MALTAVIVLVIVFLETFIHFNQVGVVSSDAEGFEASQDVPIRGLPHARVGSRMEEELSFGATGAIEGILVDETFGLSVTGSLESESGDFITTDRAGRIWFPSELAIPGTNWISSAEHYEDLAWEFPSELASGPHILRLSSLLVVGLRVQWPDGSPAAGIPVRWQVDTGELDRAFDPSPSFAEVDDSVSLRTLTDPLGSTGLRTSRSVLANIKAPLSGATKVVRLQPGEEALVTISDCVATLRCVDSSGEPP